MSDRVLLTKKGEEKLRVELKQLKSVDRPNVIAAIAEARSHGDLSENAEYDAAKDQQGFIEGRIAELESQLSIAEVIDPSKLGIQGKVVFGSTLKLYDVEAEDELTYQLVGDLEADINLGQVSVSSPIGRALVGKEEGDEVEVVAPAGNRVFEILEISYD